MDLLAAVKKKRPEHVAALLRKGANPNASGSGGDTALHIATRVGSPPCMQVLLDAGAVVDARNDLGETPLMLVTSSTAATLLLDRGADPNVYSSAGTTPLLEACYKQFNTEAVATLLRAGAQTNVADRDGNTPLLLAAKQGIDSCSWSSPKVGPLVAAGADVSAADNDGRTALHYVAKGCVVAMKILLSAGANVNAGDHDGARPLHVAVQSNATSCMELLLAADADPNAATNCGDTVLHVACRHNRDSCASALVAAGAIVNASLLHFAIHHGSSEITNIFLAAGANPNAPDGHGNSPLHVACQLERDDCVSALLHRGADFTARNAAGDTPLHLACKVKTHHVRKGLVSMLATARTVKLADADGNTPLHVVAQPDTAAVLLHFGASVTITNGVGETPLDRAVAANNFALAHVLVQSGARCAVRTSDDLAACLAAGPAPALPVSARAAPAAPVRAPPTSLVEAVRCGDHGALESLLAKGAYVNRVVVHAALDYKNYTGLIALVGAGAVLSVADLERVPAMYRRTFVALMGRTRRWQAREVWVLVCVVGQEVNGTEDGSSVAGR